MIDCSLWDIMKMYHLLHYYCNYSNADIDNMKIWQAEFYLSETMKLKEKEAQAESNAFKLKG